MKSELARFRVSVGIVGRNACGRRRFEAWHRKQAVSLCSRLRESGKTWEQASESLGVGSGLLQRWCSMRHRSTGGQFAAVEVIAEEPIAGERKNATKSSSLRLITRSGHEVRGLSVDQLREVLEFLQ